MFTVELLTAAASRRGRSSHVAHGSRDDSRALVRNKAGKRVKSCKKEYEKNFKAP